MAFLKKSLSQDAVDHYCETWAFLFLSLLAITFVFLPLAPSLTLTGSSSSQQTEQHGFQSVPEIKKERFPWRYKSFCWVPPQFTGSHRYYANSLCASAMNSLAQGKETTGAGLYQPLRDGVPDRIRPGGLTTEDFHLTLGGDQNQTSAQIDNQIKTEASHYEKENLLSGVKNLIRFKAPLFLLVIAICLRLPHAIWALLSTCCGCINVDQTLTAAQQMHSMDVAGNGKIKEELSVILRKSTKKSASLLYLLMKLLMLVVLIVGSKVDHDLVMEIDRLENERSILMESEKGSDSSVKAFLDRGVNIPNKTEQTLTPPFDGSVLLCDFRIRFLTNVHSYTVQCFFTVDQSTGTMEESSSNSAETLETQTTGPDFEKILLMYRCLFAIVLSLLIVLALLSLCSLVIWSVKLLLPSCRQSMGLKGDESIDVVFIVAMAWINASSAVATELAKGTAMLDKQTADGDEVELN